MIGIEIQCELKKKKLTQRDLIKKIREKNPCERISDSELSAILKDDGDRINTPKGRSIVQQCCAILGIENAD